MATEEVKMYTKEQFIEMYQKLCNVTGFVLASHPEFKYRDDGTFSIVVVFTVENLPKS